VAERPAVEDQHVSLNIVQSNRMIAINASCP
jgi:hypothetical protein